MSQVIADELAAHIQAVVAAAPPLTDDQLNKIVSILTPTSNAVQIQSRVTRERDLNPGDPRAA